MSEEIRTLMQAPDSPKNILIVDDEANVRRLATLILKPAGYKIVEASDGRDAMNALKEHDIELIITDFRMPRMNGIDFIKHLREKPAYRQLPVVMMTSGFSGYRKREGEAAGVTNWIAKARMHHLLLPLVSRILL